MALPAKIKKLDQVVVNRIAAGEIIQKPANALKELIENSLDAKSVDIQITIKDGGLKLLQIQDNGTGIRKEDLEIVCERFTTSKLKKFDDLHTLSTYGFRGEALASISHVAQLTITTKTVEDKVAYRASYVDGKLKGPPKPLAGNQGTTITIENLFYNVPQRKRALDNISEQFTLITEVVTRYAIHNSSVAFTLKKQGENIPHVRTPVKSTKINNIKNLYGQAVAREIISVDLEDSVYKFKLEALITNPNYSNKKLVFLLFINHRLVESTSIKKMLDDLYSIYLPKKTHPWCYISLEIDPNNVDVNVHPTKSQVKFLHEEAIIERVKGALDEKLSSNNASRTFYAQARLPQVDLNKGDLAEVLPEFTTTPSVSNENKDKNNKIQAKQMVRTDHQAQKLEKFNFTINSTQNNNSLLTEINNQDIILSTVNDNNNESLTNVNDNSTMGIDNDSWMEVFNDSDSLEAVTAKPDDEPAIVSKTAERALKTVQRLFGSQEPCNSNSNNEKPESCEKSQDNQQVTFSPLFPDIIEELTPNSSKEQAPVEEKEEIDDDDDDDDKLSLVNEENNSTTFKSYSINSYRRPVELTSVLRLRKKIEDSYNVKLKKILSEMIFIGCIDENLVLFQSDVNLYICKTKNLAEELFYEIMLYDFANYGVLKFSSALSLVELVKIGLDNPESGWSENNQGPKDKVAEKVKNLLISKAEMLKEYFSIVITKNGFIKSLPVLLEDYCPDVAGELPMYILKLATEVNWTEEQKCFDSICRETAVFYSNIDYNKDWRHLIEYVLYPAIKESLLPPKQFAHDSSILQIASLPDLYKVFERC